MSSLPNTHALLIVIADYHHVNRLPQQVRNDVQDIHDVLVDPQLCAYPPKNVTLLLDSQATQAAIRQALTDLASKTDTDRLCLVDIIDCCTIRFDGERMLCVDVAESRELRL